MVLMSSPCSFRFGGDQFDLAAAWQVSARQERPAVRGPRAWRNSFRRHPAVPGYARPHTSSQVLTRSVDARFERSTAGNRVAHHEDDSDPDHLLGSAY